MTDFKIPNWRTHQSGWTMPHIMFVKYVFFFHMLCVLNQEPLVCGEKHVANIISPSVDLIFILKIMAKQVEPNSASTCLISAGNAFNGIATFSFFTYMKETTLSVNTPVHPIFTNQFQPLPLNLTMFSMLVSGWVLSFPSSLWWHSPCGILWM